jgi:formiminoglutamase
VAGLQPHSVGATHAGFVRAHGRMVWREEVSSDTARQLYGQGADPLLVSFDLDGVDQAEAPGVSAPTAHGPPGWRPSPYGAS